MLWRTRPLPLITLLRLCLALRIDDFDHTVEYHGPWTDGANIPDDVALNWDSTLHYSNFSGSTATLKFTGTSIAVFGSVHPPGVYNMQSLYSVDGQPPFTFIPNRDVPTAIHQSLFYSSPQLSYGEHTLVVTNLGEQLFLDFFDTQDQPEQTSLSTTPSASVTSTLSLKNTMAVTVTTTSLNSLPFTTPASLPSALSSHTTTGIAEVPATSNISSGTTPTVTLLPLPQHPLLSTSALVGVVVGVASIVILAGLGVWFYRRQHMNGSDLEFNNLPSSLPKDVDVPVVDSRILAVAEDAGSTRDRVSVIDPTSSSNPPHRPRTPLPMFSQGSAAPKEKKDDGILQAATAAPISLASPPTEPSHVLHCDLPHFDNVDASSLSDPEMTTTESPVPRAFLPLPSVRADDEGVPPTSNYTPAGGRGSVGAHARRLRIQEDGGIRLAGGPPGEAEVGEEDSEGFEELPPPYQRF